MHKYGIVDDTCAPYVGLSWYHGFDVAAMNDVDAVRNHMCYSCSWDHSCSYLHRLAIFKALLTLFRVMYMCVM